MIEYILIIAGAVLLSASIVAFSLPKILLVCLKKKILDPIDPRKIHVGAASRLGGVSFLPAIFITTLLAIMVMDFVPATRDTFMIFNQKLAIELAAMLILYFVGVYDDIVSVRYKYKFVFQILTASLIVASGTYIKNFYGVQNVIEIPAIISCLGSVVLIVYITNSINLIDGVNGLASMLSIMAFAAYGALFFFCGDIVNGLVCAVAMGSLLPFFYHNVFGMRRRTKARIFMGDGGALVIGFLLAIMAIKIWNTGVNEVMVIPERFYHVIAYTMLFVPCLDVVRVVLNRARRGAPLFLPDRNHIHHKLMNLGMSQKKALLTIIGMQLFFLVANTLLSFVLNLFWVAMIDVVIWIIMHIIISRILAAKTDDTLI